MTDGKPKAGSDHERIGDRRTRNPESSSEEDDSPRVNTSGRRGATSAMGTSVSDPTARYLAAIISSTDDAIISKDLNGIVTSWNSAAERMFGYTSDEAIGRSIRLIIPTDRQNEEDEALRRIRTGIAVTHFETQRVRKDGALIPVSLSISPILDADGHVIGASKIVRDIRDRKRAEAQLADMEAACEDLRRRLSALVAASGKLIGTPRLSAIVAGALRLAHDLIAADAYVIWRLQEGTGWRALGFDGVSAEFASLISAPELTELRLTEPMVIEDALTWPAGAARRQAYSDEGIASMLVIPLVLHGRPHGALVFYHRVPHRYSEVDVHTAMSLGNLTAAAMTHAELFDERHRLMRAGVRADLLRRISRSLNYQEMVSDAVSLLVPRIADWCAVDLMDKNGELERLAAAHVDESKVALAYELRQRSAEIQFMQDSPGSVSASRNSVFVPEITDDMLVAASRGNEEQLQMLRALGMASYMCVALRGQQGVIGAVTFSMGESGRHFDEDDLALAHEVAGRLAYAIESAQAYQEAQRENRLKDSFLATLSHELRTPLNAILGYTRMLRTKVVPEIRREHALEAVERNATILAQIVNDVLDVSRIASGKLTLTIQPIGLRTLVLESVESMVPSATEKGVDVHLEFDDDDDPLPIEGDRSRLQQVFWNLLSNAVKFTPARGHINVTVKGGPQAATVIVQDSGIGIPPAFGMKVFEPFQQVNLKSNSEIGGLGLGLAIVRQIVELHGGTVTVESEGEGKGSRFTVHLPRHTVAQQVVVDAPAAVGSGAT
jgi:PAS domain S-box-containing protein